MPKVPPFTPEATIGPFYPFLFTERMPAAPAIALSGIVHRPQGQPILLFGRVVDDGGVGIRNMILESWQANAQGRYRHPMDRSDAPLDPAFDGFARVRTDANGMYRLHTILPGGHSSPDSPAIQRAPHIRLTIFGSGIDRIVTTAFFEGEAANHADPLLCSIADETARARLVARRTPQTDADGVRAYRFDIILRGSGETPFFDDWQR